MAKVTQEIYICGTKKGKIKTVAVFPDTICLDNMVTAHSA